MHHIVPERTTARSQNATLQATVSWKTWARRDSNPRPPGYEPGETRIDKRGDIYGDLETGESFGDDKGLSGKTEAGDKFYVINLDDAIDYIKHGVKRKKPVKPLSKDDKTGKGILTAIKYFLSFGDIISQTIEGEGETAEISERTARITYKAVRAYNVAQNAKSGGPRRRRRRNSPGPFFPRMNP